MPLPNNSETNCELRSEHSSVCHRRRQRRALVSKTEQGQGLLYEELNYPQIPGRLWHGEWEQVAKSIGSGE
ncbi:MAG: hypothetical protein R3C56_32690 [Pirellulaceae bacterium]